MSRDEYRWDSWIVPVLKGAAYASSSRHLINPRTGVAICGKRVPDNAVMGMGRDSECKKCARLAENLGKFCY